MFNDNFLGLNGFFWFVGVVESRQDPLKVGRVQVRVVGSHTADLNVLPTADLPWCLVMLPTTSAGISGIGQSATGLLEGSWVFGYFRDGERRQEPMVLGSLPGRPVNSADTSRGFSDPNGIYPKYINEPDVNRLAVNDPEKPHPSLALDEASRSLNVQAYNSEWNQPASSYNAVYPYNQVYESESGHTVEFDDTKDHERIHIRHRNGTRIELRPDGDSLTIVKGNNYIVIDNDNKVYIKGNSDITVNGNANIRAVGDVGVLAENIDLTASNNINLSAGDTVTIVGSKVDINP